MDINFWIEENPWIKNSTIYENKLFDNNSPTIDINNLVCDEKTLDRIMNFIDYWKLKNNLPIELLVFLAHMLQTYLENNKLLEMIVNSNNIEIIIYIIENNILSIDILLSFSIICDSLVVFKYLIDNVIPKQNMDDLFIDTCKCNSPKIMKYVLDNGADISFDDYVCIIYLNSPGFNDHRPDITEAIELLISKDPSNIKNHLISYYFSNNYSKDEVYDNLKQYGIRKRDIKKFLE